jgi:hypothetical protein
MALSGSFSAHLEGGILHFEMQLDLLRKSNTDGEQMKRLEENVAVLKHRLDVLKEANSLKQKAKNSGHLKKRWDNLKGWDLANRAIQWTTSPLAGAQPQIEWRD